MTGKLRKQADRGQKAKRILDNAMVKEAFEVIRADMFKKWEEADGPELREEIHRMLCAMKLFKGHFEHVVRTGEYAQKQLNEDID